MVITLAERYELGETVGTTGMGNVVKARDTLAGRQVAIKFLRDDMAIDTATVERFRREARIAASLSHPGIAAVYDFSDDDGRFFIVMEFLDGVDLQQLLADGPLRPLAAAELVARVADALEAAHISGAVHRDIQPTNIFVTNDGDVKTTHFGIPAASTGATLGAPQYLSPEQVNGDIATARSDIYSLGCVLYQTVTGKAPFSGETSMAVALSHRNLPIPKARDFDLSIPQAIDDIISRAMAKSPGQRFASAGQMARALRAIIGEAPITPVVAVDQTQGFPEPPSRARRKALVATAFLVAAIVALALITRSCTSSGVDHLPPPLGQSKDLPRPTQSSALRFHTTIMMDDD